MTLSAVATEEYCVDSGGGMGKLQSRDSAPPPFFKKLKFQCAPCRVSHKVALATHGMEPVVIFYVTPWDVVTHPGIYQ